MSDSFETLQPRWRVNVSPQEGGWSDHDGLAHTDTYLARADAYHVEGVSRSYDTTPPVLALRDCYLTIAAGEFVGIVGRSGSGKSTLLNLLGLIDAPTSGVLLVDGKDASGLSDNARTELRGRLIGFVFQSFHLLPARSALDNVCLPMIYQGLPSSERKRRATAALHRVGLGDRINALPSTMSGGEAQRVAIARAVAGNPRVLLCDEPTGNLDETNTEQIVGLLEELNSDGLTVVIVTHDAAVAARTRRIIQVSDGRVSEQVS